MSKTTSIDIGTFTNVGIGDPTPTRALDIRASADTTTGLKDISLIGTNKGDAPMLSLKSYLHADTADNRRFQLQVVDGNNTAVPRAMVLQPDGGNVGIGTTNPGSLLEVYSNSGVGNTQIHIHNDSTGNAAVLRLEGGRDTTNGNISQDVGQVLFVNKGNITAGIRSYHQGDGQVSDNDFDDGDLRFLTSDHGSSNVLSTRMVIDKSGNVGIGTTNPGAKLDVYGDWKFRQAGAIHTFESYSYGAQLNMENITVGGWARANKIKTSDTSGAIFFGALGGDTTLSKAYWTIADPATDPTGHQTSSGIFLLKNGNVGIGTANPLTKFHIEDNDSNTSLTSHNNRTITIQDTSETDNALSYLNFTTSNNFSSALIGTRTTTNLPGASVRSDIIFANRNSDGGFTEKMVIKSGGNVGIGTTSPTAKLDVDGPVHLGYGLYVSSDNTHTYGSASGWNYVFRDAIGIRDPDSLSFATSVNAVMTVGKMMGSGVSIYCNGSVSVNDTVLTSDDRVKHNEQNIVGAIETLNKITPKKYIKTTEMYEADHNFELDTDGNPVDANGEPVEHSVEAGVIAQQVLEVPELSFMVSPEGVDEDGNVTSPHGLNYNSLFTYAIAAIQEQQAIIEDLKTRLQAVENR